MNGWTALLELARAGFTTPSFAIFTDLITGWVLAPGRRTITGMITVGDPRAARGPCVASGEVRERRRWAVCRGRVTWRHGSAALEPPRQQFGVAA